MRWSAPILLTIGLCACQDKAPNDATQAPAPTAKPAAPAPQAATKTPENKKTTVTSATQALAPGNRHLDGVRISYVVTPNTAERAESLADDIKAGDLSNSDARNGENAHLFLHLAAGARTEPVVIGALNAMRMSWSRSKHASRPTVDADYRTVVLARLGDKSPQVRAAALRAIRPLLTGDKPHTGALKRVIRIATGKSAAGRVAALTALFNVRDFQLPKVRPGERKAQIITAHIENLGHKKSEVVAVAANNLVRTAFKGMPKQAEIAKAAIGLLEHPNPGVQGLGLRLAAATAGKAEREVVLAHILAGLSHSNAYVRASAADALARGEFLAGIHGLIALLDDSGSALYVVDGFKALDGDKGEIKLRLPGKRVDEVALTALQSLTKESKRPFKFAGLGAKERNAARAKAVSDAKAWYTANQKSLPPAPKPAETKTK